MRKQRLLIGVGASIILASVLLVPGVIYAQASIPFSETFESGALDTNIWNLSSTPAGLTLCGMATIHNGNLRLTETKTFPSYYSDKRGCAWYMDKQQLAAGFTNTFSFRIEQLLNMNKHGFAFVIQNDCADAWESDYQPDSDVRLGPGYAYISNSLAVEFDTDQTIYQNEPTNHHISIQSRGPAVNSCDHTFSLGSTTAIPVLNDGSILNAKVTYAPGVLKVYLVDMNTPLLSAAVDINGLLDLDNGKAWVGFTAQTGDQIHEIVSWEFKNSITNFCYNSFTNTDGRIAVTNIYNPAQGVRHVVMENAGDDGRVCANTLDLSVDLSGKTGVWMKYWHKPYGIFTPMPVPVNNQPIDNHNTAAEGVAIGSNEMNWYSVYPLNGYGTVSNGYIESFIYLDDFVSRYHVEFSSSFQVRFRQVGTEPMPAAGITLDNVSIYQGPPPIGQFPFFDGFDDRIIYSWWTTSGEVYAGGPPHSGEFSVGFGSGTLRDSMELTVDLAGQSNVWLNFYCINGSDDNDAVMPDSFVNSVQADGVAVSVDGVNWYKVAGLTTTEGSPADTQWHFFNVSLDDVFSAHGLSFSSAVKIRFQDESRRGPIRYFDDIAILSQQLEMQNTAMEVTEGESAVLTVVRKGSSSGSVSVDYATRNVSATAGADYAATTGRLTFTDGVVSDTVTVPTYDDSDYGDSGEVFQLILSNPQGDVELGGNSNTAVTIVSHKVSFDTSSVNINEGETAVLAIHRDGRAATTESVDYYTGDWGGEDGVDYIGSSGTVYFAVGVSNASVSVRSLDDSYEEPDERFFVQLVNPSPGLEIVSPSRVYPLIIDNDYSDSFPVSIGFEDGYLHGCWTTYKENNGVVWIRNNGSSDGYHDTPVGEKAVWLNADNGSGAGYGLQELILHVDLSGRQNITFSFLVCDVSGQNFTMDDTFTGHSNGKGIAISSDGTIWYKIQGLTENEIGSIFDFTRFTIDLDAAASAHGLTYNSDFQIKFNFYGNYFWDALGFDDIRLYSPNFEFYAATAEVLETDNAVLTVLRRGGSGGTASVSYQTSDGSAQAGSDYAAVSGTLNFGNGVTNQMLTVPIVRNYTAEADKSFTVTLSNPSAGYTLGNVNPVSVTILDDDTAAILPVNEEFNAPPAEYWTLYRSVGINKNRLELTDSGLREAIITFDPQGKTNLFLRLNFFDASHGDYFMPDSFTAHTNTDGIAVSINGTDWYKVFGLSQADGIAAYTHTNAEVNLDSIMASYGLAYNSHVQLKFQTYSESRWAEYDFDDIVIYSRESLSISTTALPTGTGMVAYACGLQVSNGSTPYQWTTESSLPDGITLSNDGIISGTPVEEGSFPLNIAIADAWGAAGQKSLVLNIMPNSNRPPFLISRSPTNRTLALCEGSDTLFTLRAADPEGSVPGYTWYLDDIQVSTLPTNLLLHTEWGDAGEHSLNVRVSDGLWSNSLAFWNLQVSSDNDEDGMPNSWERTNGLDPWAAADASADTDHDHISNLHEFQLGTSPTNADSNGDSLNDGWQNLYGQNPLQPKAMPRISLNRLGSFSSVSNLQSVAAYGNTVYTANGLGGLHMFDVSVPTNPVLAQIYKTGDYAWDVTVDEARLFWSDGTNGLLKISVTGNPYETMASSDYIYSPVKTVKSTVSGNMAYVSTYISVDDFHVLDVADGVPSPFLGDLDTTNSIRDVAVYNTLAYTAGGNGEFTVIDVSDPNAPLARGTLDTAVGSQGFEVAVTGSVAYLGVNLGDVYVADISNPDAPYWIHTNSFVSAAVQEIIVLDGWVFLAQDGGGIYHDGGLYVFDVTNSNWSVSITNILSMDNLKDIYVTSNRLYAVDEEQGLIVYDYISDYDHDGLGDVWERRHFGSLEQDADGDPDSDGVSNLGELRAGTDPQNSDTDADGFPDGWEVRYLMNPASLNSHSGNSDGDMYNDYDEYIADTDPGDASDYFCISSVSNLPPPAVYFNSSSQRRYVLWMCGSLSNADWTSVTGRQGIGGIDFLYSTNSPTHQIFYRLQVDLF